MKYRPEIDGLRALAVIPVIFFHAGFSIFAGGYVGVDIFFVISGYLITSIILSELSQGRFSIINFYERRARRILPALFFMMFWCIPFSWFLLSPIDLKDFGQSLIAVSTFLSNILFWQESGYFETASELKPLLHTWSLAIEEQYYIIFPLFLMFGWNFGIKRILIFLSLIFLSSFIASEWGAYNYPNATFFLLPTRGWELLVGVFTAFYLKYNHHFKSLFFNQLLSIIGFIIIIFSIIYFDKSTPFPGLSALLPTIGTAFLILSAVKKTIIHKLLSFTPIVGIGLISYSAYLWHQPFIAFAHHYYFEEISNKIILVLCFLSFLMAWFSWRFVENPFRDKNKFSRSFIFKFAFSGIIFFSAVGIWINYIDGGLKFLPDKEQKVFKSFINSSEYVVKRHSEILLKEFDKNNNKEDILIIGDSFSEDLVNAVFEASLEEIYDFSSFYIPNRCGVLFVENKTNIVNPKVNQSCEKSSFYNKKLQNLIANADEIWIVSSWRTEDLEYFEESIINLYNMNDNITIYGSKSFGSVSQRWYERNDIKIWSSIVIKESDNIIFDDLTFINNSINQLAIEYDINFINVQKILCNGMDKCSNFRDGEIISYDGKHFTKYGAKLLGTGIRDLINKN